VNSIMHLVSTCVEYKWMTPLLKTCFEEFERLENENRI
jgi:hypothetical protein